MFFNSALGTGAQLFLWIVILAKAVAVAVAYVDYQKSCRACREKDNQSEH